MRIEKVYEKHIGTNQELGYLPIKKEDVISAMKEYKDLTLKSLIEELKGLKEKGDYSGGEMWAAEIFSEGIEKLIKKYSDNETT